MPLGTIFFLLGAIEALALTDPKPCELDWIIQSSGFMRPSSISRHRRLLEAAELGLAAQPSGATLFKGKPLREDWVKPEN
jgi:hypothetical protein